MSKKILVVEDDPDYQDLLEAVLCPLYEITMVSSAEAAFGELDNKIFDLVITDIIDL